MNIKLFILSLILTFGILLALYCENNTSENISTFPSTQITSSSLSSTESTTTTTTTTINYNCTAPLLLNSVSLPYTATNNFTEDTLSQIPTCATSVSNVIVYNYVVNVTGTMIIECTNSTLTNAYSRLIVYDSSCNGTQLLCLTSSVKYITSTPINATSGNSYMIAFFTHDDQAMMVNPTINITIHRIPQNGEECSQAISLTNNYFDLISPSSMCSLPSKPSCFSSTNFSWYSYPKLINQNIILNFSSDTPIDIAFFTGSTCNDITLHSCFANTTYVSATLYGSPCWIAVGNNNSNPTIKITESASPFGENCSNPIVLTTGTQTVYWSASALDYTTSISNASCNYSGLYSPDIVFTYTTGATAGLYVQIYITNPNGQDTNYTVFDNCPDVGTEVGCVNDMSPTIIITIPNVMANHTYYIVYTPYMPGDLIEFPAKVFVEEVIPGVGEACSNSQTLLTGSNNITYLSNHRIQAPQCFMYEQGNLDWFSFTPSNANITFTTNASDTIAIIDTDTWQQVYCNAYSSYSLNVKSGTKYCFVLHSTSSISNITINGWTPGIGESCANSHSLINGSNALTFSSSHRTTNPTCFPSDSPLEWYSYSTTGTNNVLEVTSNLNDSIAVYNTSGTQILCGASTSYIYLYLPTPSSQICFVIESTGTITNLTVNERFIHDYTVGTSIGTFTSIATGCSGTGSMIPGSQTEDTDVNLTLPFAISLYGINYITGSQWKTDPNGAIRYPRGTLFGYGNGCYPDTNYPYGRIAVVNKDLNSSYTNDPVNNGIWSCVSGTSPFRAWTIEWRTSDTGFAGQYVIAQIVFHEGSSNFEVIYGDCNTSTENEADFVTAIQNQSGSIATNGHCTTGAGWNTYPSGYTFSFMY